MFTYQDGWIIKDHGFDYESEYTKASVYAMCNGYMGSRGALEEIPADAGLYAGNYINGIFDTPRNQLRECEIVNVPNWTMIRIKVNGEVFSPDAGKLTKFERWMDLRKPVLHSCFVWNSPSGAAITVCAERFVSMADLHCGAMRWQITAHDGCCVEIESGIDAKVANIHKNHLKQFITNSQDDCLYLEAVTGQSGYHIGVACKHNAKGLICTTVRHGLKNIAHRWKGSLDKNVSFTLEKFAAVYTSRDEGAVDENCLHKAYALADTGWETLINRHLRRWETLWDEADMQIGGDERAQIGIRFSIYHLLNSAPYHTYMYSYPARSLSGQDHRGSVFWDTEIFIAPFFIHTFPETARNMLLYRYHTLDGARRKAKSLGFPGAYYAWESHETGDEQCSLRVFRNADTGCLMVNHFCDAQIHVSADIAYCVWKYWQATGDTGFMASYGAEIVFEIARFLVGRVTWSKRLEKYEIRAVLGPDEYHELIDNNAFTNAMADEALKIALDVHTLLFRKYASQLNELTRKLFLTEVEIENWQYVRENLYQQIPDQRSRLIEQFSGYFKLEDCSVEQALARRTKAGEYLGGKRGICTTTQIIKQADVIMLLYLLSDRYTKEIKEKNWRYYEPRTEHGSSLSTMAYALVAADIGMIDWAYHFFLRTAFIDLEAKGIYSNHGVHPCSLGGAWLSIVHGFLGLRLESRGMIWQTPCIPKVWARLQFYVRWHGAKVRILYNDGELSATVVSCDLPDGIPIVITGATYLIRMGESITIPLDETNADL